MIRITIRRNDIDYGPYDIGSVLNSLESGKLLLHDLAKDTDNATAKHVALRQLLKDHHIPLPSSLKGIQVKNIHQDLKAMDWQVVAPWRSLKSLDWIKDKRLIYLAAVGLLPMFAMAILPSGWAGYWAIALYFSGLWSIFFYYIFKTPQIEQRLCPIIFFITGLGSIVILSFIQSIPPWTWLYAMTESDALIPRFIGMFLGVGLSEELCKAAVLYWVARRPGKLLMPQSVVFYGMISGLGFGIYEGVSYQMTVNRAAGIDAAYFLNIARLTSLPFFHAILTGIAGYFISFAILYPKRRYGLTLLAIGIPVFFHAVYNTFGWSIIGLSSVFLSVLLLKIYLSQSQEMQKNLTI